MSYDPKYINSDNGFTVAQRIAILKTLDGFTLPEASQDTAGFVKQAPAVPNSVASDVAGVNAVVNDLLDQLRTAGILAES